jgi:hypothetical protein
MSSVRATDPLEKLLWGIYAVHAGKRRVNPARAVGRSNDWHDTVPRQLFHE